MNPAHACALLVTNIYTVNTAEQIEKWNNYSIEILKESDL